MDITKYLKKAEAYRRQNKMTASCPPDWDADEVMEQAEEKLKEEIEGKVRNDPEDFAEMLWSGFHPEQFYEIARMLLPLVEHGITGQLHKALTEYIDAYAEHEASQAIINPQNSRWVEVDDDF